MTIVFLCDYFDIHTLAVFSFNEIVVVVVQVSFNTIIYRSCGTSDVEFVTSPAANLVHGIYFAR